MAEIDPRKFDSTQEYLQALGFRVTDSGEFFVYSSPQMEDYVAFPVSEIIGHTPVTFSKKAKAHNWIASVPTTWRTIPVGP